MKRSDWVILSIGGSLIVPNKIDLGYLRRLKRFVQAELRGGRRLVLVVGGGQTNRDYLNAARSFGSVPPVQADQLGIAVTQVNAELVRILFGSLAYQSVLRNPQERFSGRPRLLIAAGWKPGCSTDTDAVLWAKRFGTKLIVNCSDIDFVYERDPQRFRNARPVRALPWAAYRRLIPKRWSPRLSTPFDPVASRLAQRAGINVAVVNGRRFSDFQRAMNYRPFRGTLIGRLDPSEINRYPR